MDQKRAVFLMQEYAKFMGIESRFLSTHEVLTSLEDPEIQDLLGSEVAAMYRAAAEALR